MTKIAPSLVSRVTCFCLFLDLLIFPSNFPINHFEHFKHKIYPTVFSSSFSLISQSVRCQRNKRNHFRYFCLLMQHANFFLFDIFGCQNIATSFYKYDNRTPFSFCIFLFSDPTTGLLFWLGQDYYCFCGQKYHKDWTKNISIYLLS